jgi:hypothetical protein
VGGLQLSLPFTAPNKLESRLLIYVLRPIHSTFPPHNICHTPFSKLESVKHLHYLKLSTMLHRADCWAIPLIALRRFSHTFGDAIPALRARPISSFISRDGRVLREGTVGLQRVQDHVDE